MGVFVRVGIIVRVMVTVRVLVRVLVGHVVQGVGVVVAVPQAFGFGMKLIMRSGEVLAVLQDISILWLPVSSWTPMVAVEPFPVTLPYTKSNLLEDSCRRTSKWASPSAGNMTARHSMSNMRFGPVPVVEVYIPQPLVHCMGCMLRSSHKGSSASFRPVAGRHELMKMGLALANCKLPLLLTLTEP